VKRHERIAAVIVVIGGLAVACYAYAVLKLGSIFQPDAGFLPFLAGIGMVVLGICWFVASLGSEDVEVSSEKGRWGRPALAIGMMVVYAWAFEAVGYVTSTLLFMAAWQQLVERERWLKTILITVLATLAMYLLFNRFLKVPVPKEFFIR
jgi:putative tricarboxylic transport membrane protein